jgi:hypothetical protein
MSNREHTMRNDLRGPKLRAIFLAALGFVSACGGASSGKGARSDEETPSCAPGAKPASTTPRLSCSDTWTGLTDEHVLGDSCLEFTGAIYSEAAAKRLCAERKASVEPAGCQRSGARKGRCLHHCGQGVEFVETFFFEDDAVKIACDRTDGIWIE